MTDPWEALSERPDLLLVRAPIAERGRYYHRLRTIVIRAGLLLAEERATLWHEIVHADRGDEGGCGRRLEGRQERTCTQEAARRAIDLHDLADALIWSDQPAEVADQLKVTEDLLHARLDHLHPAERGYLQRLEFMKERSA